jgi:hypothetical protein
MSFRSLIEVNHDFTGHIERDPEGFVRELIRYLNSGSTQHIDLERFGVNRLGMRHHSGKYDAITLKRMDEA